MKREWSIRPYIDGDEERIFELYQAVYPEQEYDMERWMMNWRWMHKDNPAGVSKIWLAEHGSKIVGHSAIIPVVMKIGTEVITGFQSVDTMTHPDYRRQGIYETLAKKVYTEVEKEGVYVGYRFPNKFSRPIAIKDLGWFDVAPMRIMLKPLNWENALKPKISNKFLLKLGAMGGSILQELVYRTERAPIIKDLAITQVSSFDERMDEFWSIVSSQYQIIVVRDKDYLNWRYVAIPDTNYVIHIAEIAGEIYGYIVLRNMRDRETKAGIIFDVLAKSEKIAQCLISKAVEYCKQEKTDTLSCSFVGNKAYITALRRNGFIFRPLVKGRRLCAYSSSSSIRKEFLMESQNWFVQTGDSDQT